jgi:outer membrane lipopolysaccharide assembly protein LptE/RlpB
MFDFPNEKKYDRNCSDRKKIEIRLTIGCGWHIKKSTGVAFKWPNLKKYIEIKISFLVDLLELMYVLRLNP